MLKRRSDSESTLDAFEDHGFHQYENHTKKRCFKELSSNNSSMISTIDHNNSTKHHHIHHQYQHIIKNNSNNDNNKVIDLPHSDLCTHSLLYVMGQLAHPEEQNLIHGLMGEIYRDKRLLFSSLIIARISCHVKTQEIDLSSLYQIMHSVEDCEPLWNIWYNLLVKVALDTEIFNTPTMEFENFGGKLYRDLVKFSVLLHLRPQLPRTAYDLLHLPQTFSHLL